MDSQTKGRTDGLKKRHDEANNLFRYFKMYGKPGGITERHT